MTLPLSQPIQVLVEFIHNATGAPVVTPVLPNLYVVRPGQTVAELVAGAVFTQISGALYSTEIPAIFVDVPGILVAFAQATNAFSRTHNSFEIGGSVALSSAVFVPFTGRYVNNTPKLDVIAVNITLVVSNSGIALSRAVLPADFVQVTNFLAQPTPFYLVKLASTETPESIVTYIANVSGMVSAGGTFVVVDPGAVAFTLYLNPAVPSVTVEFLQETTTPVVSVVTDPSGFAEVLLPVGSYTVRLVKTGFTFTHNNVPLNTEDIAQNFLTLDAASTQVTPVATGFCKITFQLFDPTGQPVRNLKVFFYPQLGTTMAAGVVKQALEVRTNANGEGEVNLVYGLLVKVSVEGTRLNEEFTVPSSATANLFSLITFADKGFDYYVGKFDDGIRRAMVP